MQKTLDEKLARILADPSCNDFILADAKDADMAFGVAAPGSKTRTHRTTSGTARIQEFRGADSRDRRATAGRHHAHERQHERRAGGTRAIIRQQPDHARDPRERHDRHLARRRPGQLRQCSRRCRFARRSSTKSWIAASAPDARTERASGRPGPVFDHVQQRCDTRPRIARSLPGVSPGGLEKGFRHFLEVFVPNAPREHRSKTCRDSSTTASRGCWPGPARARGRFS